MNTFSTNLDQGFLTAEEVAIGQAYIDDGYVIRQVENLPALERMRQFVATLAASHLGMPAPKDMAGTTRFLNEVGNHIDPVRLNALRLAVINGVNAEPWFRAGYFTLGARLLETIVGNELVMQRRLNLSVQLPNDDSSLLPVHADVWSGDSPYEVVMWLPLVDCFGTKAMYILPPDKNAEIQSNFDVFNGKKTEDLYRVIEPHVKFIDIACGQVMVFNHNLMHGNRINLEPETRWSMNCRFKSVFSPYADKRLGEFFEPITLRPATRIGMSYSLPGKFEE